MLPVEDLRTKLLAQRHDLFRRAHRLKGICCGSRRMAEREAIEQGRTETMVRLLDRLDEREKREIEASVLALTRIKAGSYGRGVAAKTSRWPDYRLCPRRRPV